MTIESTQPDLRRHLVTALRTIEQLEEKLSTSRDAWLDEPVAIVGVGCRFPGNVGSPEAFWELLRNGVDATGEFPLERADARPFHDEDRAARGKAYTTRGAFLDRVDRFEPEVFGISPREALGMDPQHRIALEVAWEALERAGYAPDSLDGSRTGVFFGISTTDYVRMRQQVGAIEDVDAYQLVGEPSFLAGRISYTLGLRGPSQVLDTACSSSLVALHQACQALRLRQCDMALAGGVNLLLSPYGFVLMSKFQALSPDGRCKTFSADADGYARGEGAAVVVLRRLADALESGDNILAVVRGTAVNHDGRSSGLTVPNPAAQQDMLTAALAQAGVEPHEVDYVEAHGTGTSLGDPIELRALDAVLGRGRPEQDALLVGSVKTNIGHLEPVAGLAGLIKTVLAIQHGEIPPSLHFGEPNPNVDWDRLRVQVTGTGRPWPDRGRARIGGVSSFGVTGTNAHAVIASAPPLPSAAADEPSDGRRPHGLFLASARTEPALRELAEDYVRHLRREPDLSLADLCYTTHVGRAQQTTGIAAAVCSLDELADILEAYAAGRTTAALATGTLPPHKYRKTAWLFSGQGTQYAGMGRGLLAEPAFAAAFAEAAAALEPGLDRPLREVIWPPEGQDSAIDDTGCAQPALFALEYALGKLLLSWGLRPAALAGHSVGEITAACLAGVFGLADAAKLVAARARLMAELPTGGVMVALRCDEATAAAAIEPYAGKVAIGAVNGPEEVVISGAQFEVAVVRAALESRGIAARALTVSHAFHSPLMEPIVDRFREALAELSYAPPSIPVISDVTGRRWTDAEIGPEYWVRHALGAVRFADALATLHDDGFRTFCEIGPSPVLSALGARCLGEDGTFVPTLRRGADDLRQVLHAAGRLRLHGARVDWDAFHRGEPVRRVPLPTTPWRGDSYWFTEAGPAVAASGAAGHADLAAVPGIPGMRGRVRGAVPAYELDLDAEHWTALVRKDKDGRPFLTSGALADAALAAAEDYLGGRFHRVEELAGTEPVPLDGDRTVQIVIVPADDGRARCEYRSLSATEEAAGAPWRLHAHCVLGRRASVRPADGSSEPPGIPGSLDATRYGRTLRIARDALSGSLAAALGQALDGDDGVLLALDGRGSRAEVVDAAVAAASLASDPGGREGAAQPGVALRVVGLACAAPGAVRYVRARRVGGGADPAAGTGEAVATLDFYAEDGSRIGGADEVHVLGARHVPAAPAPWRDPGELLYDATWQRLAVPSAQEPVADEDFLLLADRSGFAGRLAAELRERGARAVVEPPPLRETADGPAPDPGALQELVSAWRAQAARPGRILVLTGLDAPRLDHTDAWDLEEYAARADLLTVSVVQELVSRTDCDRTRVTLVTRGAMPARADDEVRAAAAHTLWGLGRVIALEHPERWGGSIDLDPRESDQDTDRLIAALARTDEEDEQGLRDGDVYVGRIVARQPDAGELRRTPQVRPDGSYLITGAFGAIGLALAGRLARAGAGRLVLLGRTPLPDRSAWSRELPPSVRTRVEAVRELERLGAEVSVVTADVADEGAMIKVFQGLENDPLPLRGVVHAAGVSLPQYLRDADAETYRKVWRPKVLGGWLVHQLSRTAELDFFLGFSSIAATWGSQHLAAYSAGNAFLDGLAHHRRALGLPALTVAWGPWELASNLFDDEVMAFLTATGLSPLSGPQCLSLLGGLLGSDRAHQVVCAVSWPTYKPVMEARIERPMLRTIALPDDQDALDGRSRLVELLLADAAQPSRRERLTGFLRDTVAEVAGVQAESIDTEADVLALGLDSLMVMDVVRRCKQHLRLTIRASQLFERTTLAEWTDLVDTEFTRAHGVSAEQTGTSGVSGTPVPEADPTDPAWIRTDVTLDPSIRPADGHAEVPDEPRHVLLTGATGFVGAHLLHALLRRTGATVHCLVRCTDAKDGLRRIRANHKRYLTWPRGAASRITVVPGDLEKPLLGLDEKTFDELGDLLDGIIHNGAWVNFSHTYDRLRAANLTGTEEILRLSCRGRPTPVHHVSTYGIWGVPAEGRSVIHEDGDIAGAGKLVTGYVQTKWAAEQLVELGRERGIPIDVYRPGRVLGDSRTGAALTTHFTTRVIKGCVQLGLVPELDFDIEMTPIDYVASALVAIATRAKPLGINYHLVNRRTLPFATLAEVLSHRYPVRTVPVDQWWEALRASYGERENELHPVMDVVEAFVVGGEEAVDYDDENARAALTGTGITCPPLDERLLDTYLGWMTRTGYLPEPVAHS
ncbi:thioester reductase domain-containing protein [Streptomyces sp. NA02950]|uniref:type I polyketide synthase n=1 Tax=Streptomyces sp. NA02950 TaxID=2742137 RepID=UPI001590A294|nr:type I polyketide synthase [Streptomyces sp. NA02950]QKV90514.1 thioester reductase domain-containing protein [Streptomyces sp. NA02950]